MQGNLDDAKTRLDKHDERFIPIEKDINTIKAESKNWVTKREAEEQKNWIIWRIVWVGGTGLFFLATLLIQLYAIWSSPN